MSELWVARDGNDDLCIFSEKPSLNEFQIWFTTDADVAEILPVDYFPRPASRRVQTSCDGRGDERMKLYAIFDKDGKRASLACEKKWEAWMQMPQSYPVTFEAMAKRYKRAGYTCEEVEIVRKGKQ